MGGSNSWPQLLRASSNHSAKQSIYTWAFWSGERDLQCLCCAAVLFFTNRHFSSGKRDSCFFSCASALVSTIFTFVSGGRDLHCFLCASASLHNIWTLFSGERDCRCFWCAAESMTKTCAFYRERGTLNIISLLLFFLILFDETFSMLFNLSGCLSAENLFAICMHFLPYFSYSCINILFSSFVHLPLFISCWAIWCHLSRDVKSVWHRIGAQGARLYGRNS